MTDEQSDAKTPEAGDSGADAGEQPLNRAERRALEHKKKTGKAGGFGNRPAMPGGNLSRGAGNMQSRLPRTGHK